MVELARFQSAGARRIEHRAEAVTLEDLPQAVRVFGVAGENVRPGQAPVVRLHQPVNLARIAALEMRGR